MKNAAKTLLKSLDGLLLETKLNGAIVNERNEPWLGGSEDPFEMGYRYYRPKDRDSITQKQFKCSKEEGRRKEVVYYKGLQKNHNYRSHLKDSLDGILAQHHRKEPETGDMIIGQHNPIDRANFVRLEPLLGFEDDGTSSDDEPEEPVFQLLEWSVTEMLTVIQVVARKRYGQTNPVILYNMQGYMDDARISNIYPVTTPIYIHIRDPNSPDQCEIPEAQYIPELQYTGSDRLVKASHINERLVECEMARCEMEGEYLKITCYRRSKTFMRVKKTSGGFFIDSSLNALSLQDLVHKIDSDSNLQPTQLNHNGRPDDGTY